MSMKKMLHIYVVLIRGINVGGKNIVPMARLKKCLEQLGFTKVATYIASGNVVLESNQTPAQISALIESALPKKFDLNDKLVRVWVLTHEQFQAVIDNKPKGFGEHTGKYHSDAIFLMGIEAEQVMPVFKPKEGVDKIWPGVGVIYSQRLSSQRTKSQLKKIMTAPEYKLMTIRNWNTTTQLLEIAKRMREASGGK